MTQKQILVEPQTKFLTMYCNCFLIKFSVLVGPDRNKEVLQTIILFHTYVVLQLKEHDEDSQKLLRGQLVVHHL